MVLTDTKLRALKAGDAPYRVADSNGLCIEVRPTGAKVWRYRYRFAGSASMVTIGEYPAIPLQQARTERDRLRAIVKGGGNPAHAQRAAKAASVERHANTFGAIGLELVEKREREGMTAQSLERDRRAIQGYLAPIYDTPITEVTPPLLLAALRKLEKATGRGLRISARDSRVVLHWDCAFSARRMYVSAALGYVTHAAPETRCWPSGETYPFASMATRKRPGYPA